MRVDVLDVFLGRVGVVEAQVAGAARLLGDPEVQADGLGVPDMQIAVRFGRKPRRHPPTVLPRRQIVGDDRANEINRRLRRGRSVLIRHLCVFYRGNPRRSGERRARTVQEVNILAQVPVRTGRIARHRARRRCLEFPRDQPETGAAARCSGRRLSPPSRLCPWRSASAPTPRFSHCSTRSCSGRCPFRSRHSWSTSPRPVRNRATRRATTPAAATRSSATRCSATWSRSRPCSPASPRTD